MRLADPSQWKVTFTFNHLIYRPTPGPHLGVWVGILHHLARPTCTNLKVVAFLQFSWFLLYFKVYFFHLINGMWSEIWITFEFFSEEIGSIEMISLQIIPTTLLPCIFEVFFFTNGYEVLSTYIHTQTSTYPCNPFPTKTLNYGRCGDPYLQIIPDNNNTASESRLSASPISHSALELSPRNHPRQSYSCQLPSMPGACQTYIIPVHALLLAWFRRVGGERGSSGKG